MAVTDERVQSGGQVDAASEVQYWDRAAQGKVFAHPFDVTKFIARVPINGTVLDYGCGRGRLCGALRQHGYQQVHGVDVSSEMIAIARRECPGGHFQQIASVAVPFADATFDAVLLFAVLTCIVEDEAQQALMRELRRVLKPGGWLLVSDYPLQHDARNVERYEAFMEASMSAGGTASYGTFRMTDGGVVRHHAEARFTDLFAPFECVEKVVLDATTMNGNPARIQQWWLRT